MKKRVLVILICSVLMIGSGFLQAQQPVETQKANSNYKPAFPGQTRGNSAKTTTPYQVEKIAEKLGAPFAIVAMPDGRLMVTLKKGYMQIHDAGAN